MYGEGERAEHVGEGAMAHVETASVSAEGGHYHPFAVARKAASAHRASPSAHAGDRVQMARDLARGGIRLRLMAEQQRSDCQCCSRGPAHAGGWFGIVIAGDPDPVAPA